MISSRPPAPAGNVSAITYAPHGALASETLGNNLIHALVYNNRLQPTQIKLGTAALPTSVLNLTYNYGTTTNNGNVLSTTYAGGGLSYTQNFGYDQLNRLTTSSEGSSWSQTNSYDRYGNRSIVGAALTFNAANNRITTAGYAYDAAGNLTNDTIHTYGFDGENKIKTVDGVSGVYSYDGDGNRVRKNFASGEKVRMVYSGGQLIAEYDLTTGALLKEYIYGVKGLIATIEPTNGTRYTTSDHLGSPRVVTNSSAIIVSRHDYLPFGEELFAGTGGRTTSQGYSASDGVRQQFSQKERDNETGLDYFLARYYSSGRFTSPDEFAGGPDELFEFEKSASDNPTFYADIADPQSLNKYQYAYNNPLRFVDPDGHQGTELIKTLVRGAVDTQIAVDKTAANILIGASNIGNGAIGGQQIAPLQPNGAVQAISMHALDVLSLVSPLAGKTGPLNVMVAESKQITVVAAEAANAEASTAATSASSKSAAEMAEELASQTGRNSVSYRTPTKTGHIDFKDVRNPAGHFDKASGGRIKAPTVQKRTLYRGGPAGRTNTGRRETTRPATKQDIRTARKLIERQ